MPRVLTRPLTPARWPDLEALFGERGACGGCWCMYWRVPKGVSWGLLQGAPAKRAFRALVAAGRARGVLAYVDGEPVGWCALGPRQEFDKLDRAPSLRCDDAPRVGAIPCFFIRRDFRRMGVGRTLLEAAVKELARNRRLEVAEGYPVRPSRPGGRIPDAFAWTGTASLFRAAGFTLAGNRGGGKQRWRKALRGAGPAPKRARRAGATS